MNCIGSWIDNGCTADCGSTCTGTRVFAVQIAQEGTGFSCEAADGDTDENGAVVTGTVCPGERWGYLF